VPEQAASWADAGTAGGPDAPAGAWHADQAQPPADAWGPPEADALAQAAPPGAGSAAYREPLAAGSLAAPDPDVAAAPDLEGEPDPQAVPDRQVPPDDRAKKPPVWWRAARSLGGSRHHDVDEDWLRSLRGPQSQPPPGSYPRRGTPAE